MNKRVTIWVVGIVMVGVAALFWCKLELAKTGDFSLGEYQSFIERFPSEKIMGAIETPKEAIKAAEEIWENAFGKNTQLRKPHKVSYDNENGVWLVQGRLPFYMAGGVPYILIEQETGRVLAVWHDK